MFILEVSLASVLSETGHLGLFSVTMPSVFFCTLIAVQSNQTQSNYIYNLSDQISCKCLFVFSASSNLHHLLSPIFTASLSFKSLWLSDTYDWKALAGEGDIVCCCPIQTCTPFCSGQEESLPSENSIGHSHWRWGESTHMKSLALFITEMFRKIKKVLQNNKKKRLHNHNKSKAPNWLHTSGILALNTSCLCS